MIHRTLMSLALGLALAAGGSMAAADAQVPSTPEAHFALATQYKDKAAAYRKEAEEHTKMAAQYRLKPENAQAKWRGDRNAALEKMDKHCAAIAAAAQDLAVANEKAADYHTLRGKELQGK